MTQRGFSVLPALADINWVDKIIKTPVDITKNLFMAIWSVSPLLYWSFIHLEVTGGQLSDMCSRHRITAEIKLCAISPTVSKIAFLAFLACVFLCGKVCPFLPLSLPQMCFMGKKWYMNTCEIQCRYPAVNSTFIKILSLLHYCWECVQQVLVLFFWDVVCTVNILTDLY